MRRHAAVPHPHELMDKKLLDWAADHLVLIFGSMWAVIVFIVWPLISLLLPQNLQTIMFFLSSGWIQLWALPLLNYAQNKADRIHEAKANADHRALTHIAHTLDRLQREKDKYDK